MSRQAHIVQHLMVFPVVGAECGQERTPECKVRKVFIYLEDKVELV